MVELRMTLEDDVETEDFLFAELSLYCNGSIFSACKFLLLFQLDCYKVADSKRGHLRCGAESFFNENLRSAQDDRFPIESGMTDYELLLILKYHRLK